MTLIILRTFFPLSFFILMFATQAFGGYLTIEAISTLTTVIEGEELRLSGNYEITNKGNELAQNVFPAFRLGTWEWAGEGKNLSPDSKANWQIDTRIRLEKILPAGFVGSVDNIKGQFPLLVRRHYQDLNAVDFSAADLIPLNIGQLNAEEISKVRIPRLNSSLLCKGDGQFFDCIYKIINLTDRQSRLSVDFHGSQEIAIEPVNREVELLPKSEQLIKIKVKNLNALPQSTYAIFAINQWQEDGLNRLNSAVTKILIKDSRLLTKLLWGALILTSVIYLISILFRRSNRSFF